MIKGLKAAEKVFGSTKNSKGYTVITGAGVIQGDGINHKVLKDIMNKTLEEGYAANNVVFGMGGALLQKLNRFGALSLLDELCSMIASSSCRVVLRAASAHACLLSRQKSARVQSRPHPLRACGCPQGHDVVCD